MADSSIGFPQEDALQHLLSVLQVEDTQFETKLQSLQNLLRRIKPNESANILRIKFKAVVRARDEAILRQALEEHATQAEIPEQVKETLNRVLDLLGEASQSSGSYSATLEQAIRELESAKNMVEIRRLSQHLIDQGTEMVAASNRFRDGRGEIASAVNQYQDRIRELEAEVEERTREAQEDNLTGSKNRRAFEIEAEKAIAQARANGSSICLLLLDLDHFKQINDTYGHQVGDDVLVNFAKLVRARIRREDALFRLGGDEFSVLFCHLTLDQAAESAHRIHQYVSKNPYVYKDLKFNLSISGGLTELDDGESMESWFKRTDELLYRAKRGGRNRIIWS